MPRLLYHVGNKVGNKNKKFRIQAQSLILNYGLQALFFGVFHGKPLVQVENIICFRNGYSLSLLYKIRVQNKFTTSS